jgi:hypothetical protein
MTITDVMFRCGGLYAVIIEYNVLKTILLFVTLVSFYLKFAMLSVNGIANSVFKEYKLISAADIVFIL